MNKDYFINKLHELECVQNTDENSISLYDVFSLIEKINLSYSELIINSQKEATSIINNRYPHTDIMIYDFDYDYDCLSIGCGIYYKYYDIFLNKKDESNAKHLTHFL